MSAVTPAHAVTPVAPVVEPVVAPVVEPDQVVSPERPDTDDGDHDRFAHYCKKADIVRAHVTGEAILALCGKRWVPTRDPTRYPVCPTCKELKDAGYSLR